MNRSLFYAIFLGITFGIGIRRYFPLETNPEMIELLAIPGMIFLWSLRFVSVPILFSSLFLSIQSLDDTEDLKKYIGVIFPYFILTTFWSVLLAFLFSFLFFPNFIQFNNEFVFSTNSSWIHKAVETINGFPKNLTELLSTSNYLMFVISSIFLSFLTFNLDGKTKGFVILWMETIYNLSIQLIQLILKYSPYAILFLLSFSIYKIAMESLSLLGMYILVLILGYSVLYLSYSVLFLFFTKTSPMVFFRSIQELLVLAFSTSSSSAVLPKTIQIAESKLGIPKSISRFVLPLGTTINMDGTAYFQATATLFLASYYHILLDPIQLILFFFLIIAISIGTSAIPGVGIVLLSSILSFYGIPLEGIGLILGIDRLNDMIRTTINVTGDLIACIFLKYRIFDQKK
jgi:Na+/H+-dicarboxylate symporter